MEEKEKRRRGEKEKKEPRNTEINEKQKGIGTDEHGLITKAVLFNGEDIKATVFISVNPFIRFIRLNIVCFAALLFSPFLLFFLLSPFRRAQQFRVVRVLAGVVFGGAQQVRGIGLGGAQQEERSLGWR